MHVRPREGNGGAACCESSLELLLIYLLDLYNTWYIEYIEYIYRVHCTVYRVYLVWPNGPVCLVWLCTGVTRGQGASHRVTLDTSNLATLL